MRLAAETAEVTVPVNTILLLTGTPGVGKTTVLRKVAAALPSQRLAGFYTEEIRARGGARAGFRIAGFDGRSGVMAQAGSSGSHRIGKYGVDVAVIDSLAPSFLALEPPKDFYLVDEIGKMECLSEAFIAAMRKVMNGGKPIVATVALHGAGYIDEVKRRPDVEIWHVTRENRDGLPGDILAWLAKRERHDPA